MKIKMVSICFYIYLLITSTAIFSLEHNLYSLSTDAKPTGNKVCLILIDGLRFDSVSNMPYVEKLLETKSALLYKSHSGLPSNSRPGYERILTGSGSDINGISSNKNHLPSVTPDIFTLAKESGLTTSASAFYWVKELYPLSIDDGYYYFVRDGITFDKAHELIKAKYPDLLLVHPMTVDNAGHNFGGKSALYEEAVKSVDRSIQSLWRILEDKGYTIIITSDHGHRDEGGHGDPSPESTEVPLIIWSPNIASLGLQSRDTVTQLDLAPTICDLLGIPKTIYMYGNSLVKHNEEIQNIRNFFSSPYVKDFPYFFRITSRITYFIISLFTVIYLGCGFVIIKALVTSDK